MHTLLNDIELDIQELKCLLQAVSNDANPVLRTVAKRNILQMKARLDALSALLDREVPAVESVVTPVADPVRESSVVEPAEPQPPAPTVAPVPSAAPAPPATPIPVTASSSSSSILGERIKTNANLRSAISLNDSFRFTRELFGGDSDRMNATVRRLSEALSLDEALCMFRSEVCVDEQNEAAADFIELLKKYFS